MMAFATLATPSVVVKMTARSQYSGVEYGCLGNDKIQEKQMSSWQNMVIRQVQYYMVIYRLTTNHGES